MLYMKKLKLLANAVPKEKGKQRLVAAAYDKKGNLLAVGYNSYVKTHPRQSRAAKKAGLPLKEYLHAEIATLVRCKEPPHMVVVCRVDAKGNMVDSTPCPVCTLAMKEAGVKLCVSSQTEEHSFITHLN